MTNNLPAHGPWPSDRIRPPDVVDSFLFMDRQLSSFCSVSEIRRKGESAQLPRNESSSFSLPRRVLCFHRLAATQVERDARPSVKFCSVALEFCIIRSLFFGGFSFALSLASAEGELVCRRISAVYEIFLKRRPFAMLPNRHNGFVGKVGTFWVFHFSEFGVEL